MVPFTACGQVCVGSKENIVGIKNSWLYVKSVRNDIFCYVKFQRKSIAFYQTWNDRNMLCSSDTVKVMQKHLSTPCHICYVQWAATSM